MDMMFTPAKTANHKRFLYGAATWIGGWLVMLAVARYLDLGNLGMLLVLTSAVAAIWLPVFATLLVGILGVMTFNWMFVPPQGSFAIDFHQHTILLIVMFVVNMIVAALMIALREHVKQVEQHALAADTLRTWGDRLRDVQQPQQCLRELRQMLASLTNVNLTLLALREQLPVEDELDAAILLGETDAEQLSGLWYCLRNGQQLGPNTGRYQELPGLYLPMRGRTITYGAAMLAMDKPLPIIATAQAQALCDQMGAALERHHMQELQQRAQKTAQEQELRTTLLAAISHDYRTPLATIMGAASSLQQQAERLSVNQQKTLAHRIVTETEHLRQMTGNILQLARLDNTGAELRCDWEAAEELIGSLVQRFRARDQQQRLRIEVEPGLPLLWCDTLLICQLLDNLLDNAFKYSSPGTAVHLIARRQADGITLAVRDEGPGIPQEQQQIIFRAFKRGELLPARTSADDTSGVGIGLALCRAIANAHGGELQLESNSHGSCFTCLLPLRPQPDQPTDEEISGAVLLPEDGRQ